MALLRSTPASGVLKSRPSLHCLWLAAILHLVSIQCFAAEQVTHPTHWTARAAAAASLFLCPWLLWLMAMLTWASRSSCHVLSATWPSTVQGLGVRVR